VSTNNGSAYYPLSTNRFLYDGWNLVAIVNPGSSLVQSFMWGLDLSGSPQGAGGVGGLVAIDAPSTGVQFMAMDGNGNVAALVKATDGSVAATYEYGPAAEVIRSTGTMAESNPFRFSTKYEDDETDLVYYGGRYLKASTGGWLSRDPAEEDGGPNLYGFLGNNPVNDVDAFGLMRYHEVWETVKFVDNMARAYRCCCDKPTRLSATITGSASGQTVTDTVNLQKIGCVDSITVIAYYWWDCATAQSEYDGDHSPTRPSGRQAWQDYGWHLGGNPQTQSHKGWKKHWWDIWDLSHWNWSVAVIYTYCGKDGHYHGGLAFSNYLEWTWGAGGWGNSHDGSGSKVQ
jgi:RHS repeat-associated protein